MKRDEVNQYIGRLVTINGLGDLGMERFWRDHIYKRTTFKIKGLTKGGLAILDYDLQKLKNHFPAWRITHNLETIIADMVAAKMRKDNC